ncbi:unnamed protein product [Ectocarpus fasciculatus]
MADSTLQPQETAGGDDGQNDAGQNEGGVGHPADQADNAAHDANVETPESRGREEDPSPPLVGDTNVAPEQTIASEMSGADVVSDTDMDDNQDREYPVTTEEGQGEEGGHLDQLQQEDSMGVPMFGNPESPVGFGLGGDAAQLSKSGGEDGINGDGRGVRETTGDTIYPNSSKAQQNNDDGDDYAVGMGSRRGFGEGGQGASDDAGSRSRRMFDGSRVAEPDNLQIVEAGEGADIIPGVDDLPVFANDQSKALNDEIKVREKNVAQATNALADNRERVRIMEEHLKNVRQEVGHTNALMAAKKKEIATEEHLCALAAREAGRYTHDARRFVVEAEEAQDKLNGVQNAIFGANEEMDRFKLQMNWNQEELEQWALAAKQKEEDNLALQKYARADDVKIKDLSLQVERLSKSVVARRAELQNLEAESSAKQVELDNTAADFRRLHAERQDLVRQWQNAIDGMRRRDEEINAIGEKYAAARQVRATRIETLAQNAARLKMQRNDNKEVQGSIENLERTVQRQREEAQAAQKRLEEFRDVLEVVKNTLGNGAGALARKRGENANLTAQIEEKRVGLDTARRRYQASGQRVETETGNTNKVEATAKSAEEELQQREAELKASKKRLATAKELMFRDSQKLYALRQEEANFIAEICGAQATMKNLQTKVHALDQEQTRQQELIYSAEFQIQQMERKVARGMGERTDEEKSLLNAKIRELEGEVEVMREEKKMLTGQARKLNNELRASLRRREAASAQQAELNEAINELELECRAAEGDVKRESQTKEELMVSNDVMRLEVKRLRDTLNGAADEVFSLENRRQQLAMSMKERKAEIQVHWDLQRATLRAAEEERHRVQLELGDRRQAVEKLRAKYETLAKGFAGAGAGDLGGDHAGGGSSQAYFIIAAAQKREELQREGDELDQEIRSFQRADPGCKDADALRSLEARAKAAQDGLFRRKKELQRAQTDHEEDLARLDGAKARAARLDEQNAQLDSVRVQAEAQLDAQRQALTRAEERLASERAMHRKAPGVGGGGGRGDRDGGVETMVPTADDVTPAPVAGGTATAGARNNGGALIAALVGRGGETLTEKALRASTLRDTASGVLYTLGQLAREFPEMHDALNTSLHLKKLKVPPAPPAHGPASGVAAGASKTGRASSAAGSRAGSESSSRVGGASVRSSTSGGGMRGGSLGDRRGSRAGGGGSVAGEGISPMRLFEAPI